MPDFEFDSGEASMTSLQPIPMVRVRTFTTPHVLQMVQGPDAPRTFELTGDALIVGRAVTCDIRIPLGEMSRQHMRLDRHQGGFRAVDLDSSNGLYLNEIRVKSAVLRDNDVLQLGDVAFVYHEGTT